MRILAIETSCDDTGIAIIDVKGGLKKPLFKVLANITSSQVALHAKYGGVFPMMAKREHAKSLTPLLIQSLKEAKDYRVNKQPTTNNLQAKKIRGILEREPELAEALIPFLEKIKKPKIDAIAVTYGPGLEPTLWVGINFAKALSLCWDIPLIPINHMEGHIFSAFAHGKKFSIQKFKFPVLTLLISGGHTELVLMRDWFKYKIIGETRDDAAGEAFDKVARMLGLPYPGGPEISRLAKLGSPASKYKLPRPMIHSGDSNFSFSGLKTAVLYTVKKIPKLTNGIKADIAREFEDAVTEVLVVKTLAAAKKYKIKTLILGGGVAANVRIRAVISSEIAALSPAPTLYLPDKNITGDNALMIATAGYFRFFKTKDRKPGASKNITAKGNLRL